MIRIGRNVVLAAVVVAVAMSLGCAKEPEAPKPEAKITPPAVKTAGVLVAGVDLSTPPFAGADQGKQVGIDVDVASALAERLGVAVKLVDVKPAEAATALAAGKVDVVLSVPIASSDLSQLSLAGSYLADAPGFFVSTDAESVVPSMTLSTVKAPKVGVQTESESYWLIRHQLDPDAVEPYASLREAIQALSDGKIELVAGDALIAAYIARDFPKVHFAGQLAGGSPLAVAVAVENTTLSDAVRTELDALAADGVLDTIRRKWVGDLPELEVESGAAATPAP